MNSWKKDKVKVKATLSTSGVLKGQGAADVLKKAPAKKVRRVRGDVEHSAQLVADVLKVSRATIIRMVKDGRLKDLTLQSIVDYATSR